MDEKLISQINEKLSILHLNPWQILDEKTKERLISIQIFVNLNNNKIMELVNQIKGLQLTKSSIANSKDIPISRKTLYQPVLNEYIELLMNEQMDVFNKGKLKRLNTQLKDMEEKYNKILIHTIDTYELKKEIRVLNDQINSTLKKNEELHELIFEKNQIISDLKRKLINDNVIKITNDI